MKAYRQIISGVLAAFALIGCTDDNQSLTGEGKLMLNVSINSEIQESRAVSSETQAYLSESLVLWITDKEGNLVREYEGMANIPSEGISLACGDYLAEAWAGNRVPASFVDCWYQSEKVPFTIANGVSSSIELNCQIANAVVRVEFADDINEYLENYALTVRHEVGKVENGYGLVFPTDNYTSGYFSILSFTDTPAESNNLYWSFVATNKDGGAVKADGSSFEIKKAHGYTIKISTQKSETSTEFGGGLFNIEIDEEPLVTANENVVLAAPPVMKYRNGDEVCLIDEPMRATPESVGEPSLWIFGSSDLTDVTVTSDLLSDILADGATSVNLRKMIESVNTSLEDNGLHYEYKQINGTYRCELSLKETFIKSHITDEGTFTFTIEATDKSGMKAVGTFTIIVSNDPLVVNQVTDNNLNLYWEGINTLSSASISGNVMKAVNNITVYYKLKSDSDWASYSVNNGSSIEGDETFTAPISGLKFSSDYEYYVTATQTDGSTWTSPIQYFTTPTPPQLPNASFEDWQTSSTPYLIYPSGGTLFWDSGNHGSATMSKNVTVPDSDVKHSGNYSVKLASQFVGIGSIGKFAAGNVFIGKYLDTEGTNGVIGFGRPFTAKPTAVKVWVKYRPVAVDYTNSNVDLNKGDLDQGIIYIALLDNNMTAQGDTNYPEYPVVVRTKEAKFFDKTAANVIAHAEKILTGNTDGEGLVQITIPLTFVEGRTNDDVYYLLLTAAASRGGDYFAGGSGTNMWLDDFELVYE